jgi:CRP/FNR family transcriptional regulator, cyclic AMP receptor protein
MIQMMQPDIDQAVFSQQHYPRFLDMLEPQEREALLSIAVEKVVKKGQLLYHQGDPCENLFIIQSGAVKVYYVHDNGSSLTTFYHRDGMLVGAHGCSGFSGNHFWTAQALVDSRVLWIKRSEFLAVVNQSMNALRAVISLLEFKDELLKKVVRILAEPTLEGRIVMAVRHLATLYGVRRGEEIEIDGHFTHQEIAEMVGASRQSVTTLLVSLEKSGDIRREGRRLFIPLAPARKNELGQRPVSPKAATRLSAQRVPLTV